MIDGWLSQIAEVIGNNMWLAPLLALLAGVLTSITPCSLSSVPLIIGYVGGVGERNTKKAFAYSAVFSDGGYIRNARHCRNLCRETDGNILACMVYHSWCTNGIDGFADLGSIQLHSLDQLDFQKQEAWIYRSFPCGYSRWYFFLALLYTCSDCATCHCRR